MRYLTILFLIVSFLWWVLLLVSIFVSPPGMHSRGSGFFDFAYTCLTIGNLLVATIFFVTPAKGLRITTAIIAVLLAVDMIVILAVPRIRLEEGWIGIASVVWAFLMAVWCILTDRVVAYGKREEEERLTGRAETRRTLKEWIAVLVATVLTVIFIIIVILMTATLGIRARDSTLKMYGDRILVDGDISHVLVMSRTPMVRRIPRFSLRLVRNLWSTIWSTGHTLRTRTVPSRATATGTVQVMPSPTTLHLHTLLECRPTHCPKPLPGLVRRVPGSLSLLVPVASSPESSAPAT
jgi:hypothetical protein